MSCNDPNAQVLADQEDALNSGITQSSHDGSTTTINHQLLSRRHRELAARSPAHQFNGRVRPVIMKANFSRYLS